MDAPSPQTPFLATEGRGDLADAARELSYALGPKLVAALAGTADREALARWAAGDGSAPTEEVAANFLVARQVWRDIAAVDGGDVTRAWFVGMNPNLGDDSPVTAIREGRHRQVAAAGRVFLAN